MWREGRDGVYKRENPGLPTGAAGCYYNPAFESGGLARTRILIRHATIPFVVRWRINLKTALPAPTALTLPVSRNVLFWLRDFLPPQLTVFRSFAVHYAQCAPQHFRSNFRRDDKGDALISPVRLAYSRGRWKCRACCMDLAAFALTLVGRLEASVGAP